MKPIKSKSEYHLGMAEIETYLVKGFSQLTSDEDKELYELSLAVSEYEKVYFPMPV